MCLLTNLNEGVGSSFQCWRKRKQLFKWNLSQPLSQTRVSNALKREPPGLEEIKPQTRAQKDSEALLTG